MSPVRRTIRLLTRLASDQWQCMLCGQWFTGGPSQTCGSCS